MNENQQKIVGIIGGMGPDATAGLFRKIIKYTPANDDAEHLRILIDNNTKIPSRIKAIIDNSGPSPLQAIIDTAKRLEEQGAQVLVMPCNTAHYYYQDISKEINVPLINIVENVKKSILEADKNVTKVGILASTAVKKIKLFESYFDTSNIEIIYPDNQDDILDIIKHIKAGTYSADEQKIIDESVRFFKSKHIENVIVACTEISLIDFSTWQFNINVFDALDELAKEVVVEANNGKIKV